MKTNHFCFGTLVLGSAAASFAPASGLKITLPPETAVFKPGQHVEIANAQCLLCHSVEYVTTQPPLPRSYWKATVEKMQQKFGAPIPVAQVEPLLDYLMAQFGAGPATGDQGAPGPAASSLESRPVPGAGAPVPKAPGALKPSPGSGR